MSAMQISRGRPISAVASKQGTNVPDYGFEIARHRLNLCKARGNACPVVTGRVIHEGQLCLRTRTYHKTFPQEFVYKHFGCIRGPTWTHIKQHYRRASDLEGFADLPQGCQAKVRRAFTESRGAYEDVAGGIRREEIQYVDLGGGISIGIGNGSVDKGKRKAVEGWDSDRPSKKPRPSPPTGSSISYTHQGGQHEMLDTAPANALASGSGLAKSNASNGLTIESFGDDPSVPSNQDSPGSSSARRLTRSMGSPTKPDTQTTLRDEPDTVIDVDEDDNGSSPGAPSNSETDSDDDTELSLLGGGGERDHTVIDVDEDDHVFIPRALSNPKIESKDDNELSLLGGDEHDTALIVDEDDHVSSPGAPIDPKIEIKDDNELTLRGDFVNAFAELAQRLRGLSDRVFQGKIQLVVADQLSEYLEGYKHVWVAGIQRDSATPPPTGHQIVKSGEELLQTLADKLVSLANAVEEGTIDFADARPLNNDTLNLV